MILQYLDTDNYLSRLGIKESIKPSLESFKTLHKAHLMHIPFENLDIHTQTPIVLDINKIYQKIVLDGRGGFCYELNGLFAELLISLGFQAQMVSAQVYSADDDSYSPEFDHMAILVHIHGEEYLADVGFGEFTECPLQLELNVVQHDPRGHFKIVHDDEKFLTVMSKDNNSAWVPEYRFTPEGRELSDFRARCHFHQTSPDSHFMKKRICSIATRNGRMTLTDTQFKITENAETREHAIENAQQFKNHLQQYFRISL